jgi:hypothetical protein
MPKKRRPNDTGQVQEQPKNVPEIIRPEVNFEKWAHIIFGASHSRSIRNKSKLFKYTDTLPDGSSIDASILVEAYNGKLPSTKTRRVLLALIKVYESRGVDARGILHFSLKEIADILRLEWGSTTAVDISRELFQLLNTPITWKYIFIAAQGEKLTRLSGMHIVDEVDVVEKKDRKGRELIERLNIVRFNPYILENLKAGKTKPINFAVTLELRSEIAQMLYAHLDVILSDKAHYERTTKNLFSDLFLEAEKEYRYPFGRKRKLEKAIGELNGKPLTTGILQLRLEKTKDETDYKLVANKIPVLASAPPTAKKLSTRDFIVLSNPPKVVDILVSDMCRAIPSYKEKEKGIFKTLAKKYKAPILQQAIAELKADGRDAKNPMAFFLTIVHRLAHQAGLDWIADCGDTCQLRRV